MEVLIRHVVGIFLSHKKQYLWLVDFSEINKRGGSNKAFCWENLLKKNKKNFTLIKELRVLS